MNKNISKSTSKRVRITKNGKIVRRSMGIGHNRTRKTRKRLRHKKMTHSLNNLGRGLRDYSN